MTSSKNIKDIDAVNAILPQTQCGLCTYKGCKPYAEAIVNQDERIDLCLPGGVVTLKKIGELCHKDSAPLEAEMRKKQKPSMLAVIREAECIGCTKCIQACPVDAIVGAAKLMHTVITDACNGCELCVAPCPVDCIDMMVLPEKTETEKALLAKQSLHRFEKHNERLTNRNDILDENFTLKSTDERKADIADILKRIGLKK